MEGVVMLNKLLLDVLVAREPARVGLHEMSEDAHFANQSADRASWTAKVRSFGKRSYVPRLVQPSGRPELPEMLGEGHEYQVIRAGLWRTEVEPAILTPVAFTSRPMSKMTV